MQPLNLALADLPAIGRPRNHAEGSAALDARRAKALDCANNTLDLAHDLNMRGDVDAARDLIVEAQQYLAEVRAIDERLA